MAVREDLQGQKFNRLNVVEYHGTIKGKAMWKCKCICGNESVVASGNLKNGNVKSCGCLIKDATYEDLSGRKFGMLTAIKFVGYNKSRNSIWECFCECGNIKQALSQNLKRGKTKSCGCYQAECRSSNNLKHGLTDSPTNRTWLSMIQRCNNPQFTSYNNYGGRGITVCDEWMDFEKFVEDMGIRPDGKTLDRIDNSKGYTRENCKWSTIFEQASNKRNNNFITYNGKKQTLSQWAQETGFSVSTLWARINQLGWDTKKAFTTPLKTNSRTQ
jgi:hypothetical protein